MEPLKSCDVTSGYEHYLRHILFLGQVSPIALKAIIKREQKKCGKDIRFALNENRHTFKTQYETEYLQLFKKGEVIDDIDTWDTLQLCAVTLALFKSDLTVPEVKAIQCIYDQRKDIENYVECASLTYKTYKEKQYLLLDRLRELSKFIDNKASFNCKRMLFSFEFKSMKLSKPQIGKLTRTNDINIHLKIAMEIDVVTENDITGEEKDQMIQTNDEELSLVVDLPVKIKVTENKNIDIECKTNLITCKPVWRHNGKLLQSSARYNIIARGTKHKLMLMNITLHDEGEYTVDFGKVSSKTTVIVQGELDILHRKQMAQELYRNWVRGALALKYLKRGLEDFSDKAVKKQHKYLIERLGNICNTCTDESLLPHKPDKCPCQNKQQCFCYLRKKQKPRQMCPNGGFCGKMCDRIVCNHRFRTPLFTNTDVQKWSSDPWIVATCFINTPGYKGKQSAKEVDCSGLLSLCINSMFIEMMLGKVIIDGKRDAFAQAREARNDILHNPNYELSDGKLNKCIKMFKEVLEIKDKNGNTPLKKEPGVEKALLLLDKVQRNQIEINLEHEVKELREHGMSSLEDKYQTAKQQHELKLQLIEQQIKDRENELRLMLNLRSEGTRNNLEEHFLLDLQLRVIAKNGEKNADGNQRLFEAMRDYIKNNDNDKNNDEMNGLPFATKSTDTPVYLLVDCIKAIDKCQIVAVFPSSDHSSTDIQIKCLSSEAIDSFLKSINCNTFQQKLFELRRWLYVHYNIETQDIIANCSSNGIEKAKQSLHFTDVTRNMNCANHQNTQCTLYCPDHDTFFCKACRESKHSTCLGIKQVISEISYVEQELCLAIKGKKESYNVRVDNTFEKHSNSDQLECNISGMCMLHNGEVLLADFGNKRLKKLNSLYKVNSYCDVPEYPYYVCYIGNDTAVASLKGNYIQYVNVSGNIHLKQLVTLDHACLGLACHRDTLYINSGDTVYKYDKDCKQRQVIITYQYGKGLQTYRHSTAISDNGERIYYLSTNTDLTTIYVKGNHERCSSFHGDQLHDICIAAEGIVLVLDKANKIYQLDYNGRLKLAIERAFSRQYAHLCSICFDRKQCRLIVGGLEDEILVYSCKFFSR